MASAWLTSVVRVGNAVYVETVSRPGRLDEAAVDRAAASVTAYVPELPVFRG